jgi:FKBP-type peptidyl-prolyl cis-trans isomerase 2
MTLVKFANLPIKIVLYTLVLAAGAALASCGGDSTPDPTAAPPSPAGPRIALDGDTVSVHYRGTLDNGEMFDTSRRSTPLSSTVGAGQMISGFDAAVRGMALGETKTVRLEPQDAYGERSDDLIIDVPRDVAPTGVAVGDKVRLNSGAPAVILEITDEYVRVDANFELAGQALTFEIELVSIQ